MMENANLYVRRLILRRERIEDPAAYPFCLPAVRHLEELAFTSPVTFLMGENGTGKSTLLEAIAVASGFNAEGGSKNFNFSTRQTHSPLHEYLTLVKGVQRPRDGYFLRAESFYNVASEVDNLEEVDGGMLGSYGGKSLHAQSHGESFMSLLLNRFGGRGLYILDEPEAALSPVRQMTLLRALYTLVQGRSQFIIATHSPILTAYPGAEILVLDADGITPTPYEQTEHYQITRDFLNHPERCLKELLEDN